MSVLIKSRAVWRGWLSLVVVLWFGLAACGGQNVASNTTSTTATPRAAIRWSQTSAPQGVDVPGAQWLKIEGAGGASTNVQVAAVVRPQGPGPFPLVVWLHGGQGFHVGDVSKAARLIPAGFMVLVGCWQRTPADATVYNGVSYQTIPCLHLIAGLDDAVRALIDVGRQLPGVKNDAIGLFGVSSSGPLALDFGSGTDIKAVVVDSTGTNGPSHVNAPVLMLGGTADPLVDIQLQRAYEQTLRQSGSTVEAHFYQGGIHGVTYFGDFQDDAIRRMIDFYLHYLK